MSTVATSVVSAAVISGDLILGLNDGSIINCGRVQGPQGLKGDQGPMGATGRPGTDGNTIHTVAGAPDTTLGKDGDFAINTVVWEIYGPRAGGVWGTGTPLRGNKRGEGVGVKEPMFGAGSGGNPDGTGGGRAYNTANLPLAGTGRRIDAPGGNIIPVGRGLEFQSNLNRWIVDSLQALDQAIPVAVGDVLPDEGAYDGDLFIKDGQLYIYTMGEWQLVGVEDTPPVFVGENLPPGTPQAGELWYCTDERYLTLFVHTGTTWAPAAPPVSLDGIEGDINLLQETADDIKRQMALSTIEAQKADLKILNLEESQELQDGKIGDLEESQTQQDKKIEQNRQNTITLQEQIEQLAPSFERGSYQISTTTLANGEYNLIRKNTANDQRAERDACQAAFDACKRNPDNDEIDCNRDYNRCLEDIPDPGTLNVLITKFSEVEQIKFNRFDQEGVEHDWSTVEVGQLIDIFNDEDESFVVAKVTDVDGTSTVTLSVDVIQAKGEASGVARVKVFELADEVDPSDYVRKTGDIITGSLKLYPESTTNPLVIHANDEGDSRSTIINVKGQTKEDGTRPAIFSVVADGRVNIDDDVAITSKWQVTHKKYVDEKIAEAIQNIQFPTFAEPGPAQLCWEYRKPSSGKGPADGTFWLDSNHFRFSFKTHNGVNLGHKKPALRDEWGAPGAADNYGAYEMTIWKKYSGGWYMYDHLECSDTRWTIKTDGVEHFQFKKLWSSHKQTLTTGQIYYITVGGFF